MSDVRAPSSMNAPMGVKMRNAEEADGQTTIDREDADRHRRGKRTDVDKRKPIDIYEDLSEVSIALLRGFLEGLLESREKVQQARKAAPPQAYALQAYQSVQRSTEPPPAPASVGDDAEIMGVTRLDLAAEGLDKEEVQAVLALLEQTETAGIHHIAIQKSSSFLASIREGIARAIDENVAPQP